MSLPKNASADFCTSTRTAPFSRRPLSPTFLPLPAVSNLASFTVRFNFELNMNTEPRRINTKQLRAEMAAVIESVRKGGSFLVLHRSHPAFLIVPAETGDAARGPLADDPIYHAEALGKSRDGLRAADHDGILYGA